MKLQYNNLYIDFGNLRISMSSDPDDQDSYYHQYYGKIIGEDKSEKKTGIGEVKLAYFSLFSAASNRLSEFSVLDGISYEYDQ